MRKLCSILLSIALLLQMSVITVFAASPKVVVGSVQGDAGETVDVTVELVDCPGFINLALEFGYDPSVLTLENVVNGVDGALFNKAPSYNKNPYNIIWNSTENIAHSGTIVTLQFRVSETASDGICPITVNCYRGPNGTAIDGVNVNYDEDLNSLGLSYSAGSVIIGDGINTQPQGAHVKVNAARAKAGESVEVMADLVDCEGFINLALEFGYDSSVLTLEKVTNCVNGALVTKAPDITKNPYNIIWNATENVSHNGTLVILQFKVSERAVAGNFYPITVNCYKGPGGTAVDGKNVNYDENLKSLGLSYIAGIVSVKPEQHTLSVEKSETDSGFNLKIKSDSPEEMSGVIIAALYNGSHLVKAEVVDAQECVDIPFFGSGDKIKVMWWNSVAGLVPLCGPFELPAGSN